MSEDKHRTSLLQASSSFSGRTTSKRHKTSLRRAPRPRKARVYVPSSRSIRPSGQVLCDGRLEKEEINKASISCETKKCSHNEHLKKLNEEQERAKQLHDANKDRKLKNYLLYALKSKGGMEKHIEKLESCRCGVRVESGVPKPVRFSCRHKFCPKCFTTQAVERRAVLTKVFHKAKEHTEQVKKAHPYWITLTIDSKRRGVPKGTEAKLKWLRKRLTQFLNSRWSRKHLQGTYYRMETTWRDEAVFANHHIHLVAISDLIQEDFYKQLEKKWGLGFTKVKKWRFDDLSLEFSKGQIGGGKLVAYLNKPFSMEMKPERLAEVVDAYTRTKFRSCGATGIVKNWLKEAKEENDTERKEQEEELDMPKPPTGVPVLKDGFYSKRTLLELSSLGDTYACYCLKFLEWWKKKNGQLTPEEASWWRVWSPNAPR